MTKICVTGAGGFIGTHLVRRLKQEGYWVRGVDVKRPQWSYTKADEFIVADLREVSAAKVAINEMDWVFALAADMGGAGFVFTGDNDLEIMRNNFLININTLEAARESGTVSRYLFSSSACVYPEYRQDKEHADPLKEDDAYPALPDSIYGWEKLITEKMCGLYNRFLDISMRVVRFHNVYGSMTEWTGGREKAPAAMCRKVAMAKLTGDPKVEIWGDGKQERSFMYIDDCLEGLMRLMKSNHHEPLNLGRDRMITIDGLVDIVANIAGIQVEKVYVPGPQGVRSRNSNNSLCREVLGWAPSISLEDGLIPTYQWVEKQVKEDLGIA